MLIHKILTLLRACRLLSGSELFDSEYYSRTYNVPRGFAVLHYLLVGGKKEYDPSEEFSSVWYNKRYPDVKAAGVPALLHYLTDGIHEDRFYENSASRIGLYPLLSLFDSAWYYRTYMKPGEVSPMKHYLEKGWQQGNLPFAEFDRDRFLRENPDCDTEPLDYWYRHRLPNLYFTDLTVTLQKKWWLLEKPFHFWQDANIDRFMPIGQGTKPLTLMFAPGINDSSVGTYASFCRFFRECSADADRTTLAVTMPGMFAYTGEGMFPEDVRVFRYSYAANRLSWYNDVTVVVPDRYLGAFLEWLRYNEDDSLLHIANRRLVVLDAHRNDALKLLMDRAKRYFPDVRRAEHEIEEPGDCPYFGFFNKKWYFETYQKGTAFEKMDSKDHYLSIGSKKHYKPFEFFDIDRFYADHPDCIEEPLFYCYRNRLPDYYFTMRAIPQMKFDAKAGIALQYLYKNRQNALIEQELPYFNDLEKAMVIILSPEDAISGGIMSFYGIYHITQQLEKLHGRKVFAVSIPGDTTQAGFTMFRNDMPVYRYEMVMRRLHHVKDILVMLPEIYVETYVNYLQTNTEDLILSIPNRHLNVMNQKIEVMPEPDLLRQLDLYFPKVTQTVAHYKYCTQKERDYYGLPMHLLIPPIIKEFTLVPHEEKEDIFAYSYDEQPWKQGVLDRLKQEFPELKFMEIKGLMFDEYLDLIHRARWCMTFGEGLDGYFSEPYQAGGISFAVWNDDYFTERYHDLPTVLASPEDALNRLPELMRSLDNKADYEAASALVREVHGQEYATKRTPTDQLVDFFNGKYDFP